MSSDSCFAQCSLKMVITASLQETVLIALVQLESNYVDLVICDIMMPRMDGYELTQTLRDSNYSQPMLMITAKESITDKQLPCWHGRYMVKPIDIREILCRVVVLLRRSQIISERKLTLGSTVLDYNGMTVQVSGVDIPLHQKGSLLLYKLATYVNHIFNEIWGIDSEADSHTLDVHISRFSRLRDHFKNNEDFEIITVRGLGYKVVRKG